MKNNLSAYDYDQKQIHNEDILNALGLKLQSGVRYENEYITEITKVIRGSIADNYGQLQVGKF